MINSTKLCIVVDDQEWAFNGSYSDLLGLLNEAVSVIPAQYIEATMVEIRGYCKYGEPYIALEMSYRRPFTEEEMKIQNDKDAQLKKLQIEKKILNFNKLRQELEREGYLL